MRVLTLVFCLALTAYAEIPQSQVRAAATTAVATLERSIGQFLEVQQCASCHHQVLPAVALRLASERGVPVKETLRRRNHERAFGYLRDLDAAVQYSQVIDSYFDSSVLFAAGEVRIPRNLSTAVYARMLAGRQTPEGFWRTADARPPQAHGLFTPTALAIRVLQKYLPEQLAVERRVRVEKARRWLEGASPASTEQRVFQLLGLAWADAAPSTVQKVAATLAAEQHDDGGWGQLPGRVSDAYSTGQALYAIHAATGMSTSDSVYERGMRFLLSTQKPDGSWLVQTRLHPPAPLSPPFVDVDYPHGRNQFISATAANWAIAALTLALKPPPVTSAPAGRFAPAAPRWAEAVLFGSTADVRKLLDAGLKPDSATPGGTTALMMAATSGDADKVRLLIERGADVHARSKSGYTALVVASNYGGTSEVIRLLLAKGAAVEFPKGQKPLYDASPVFLATGAGDLENVKLLLAAGASPNHKMQPLGLFQIDALSVASFLGDARIVRALVASGANIEQQTPEELTPLSAAVLADQLDAVRALLELGANVNHADKLGMTPLLYAANVDFGNTAVIEMLLAGGANPAARTKEGTTALDQARHYGHTAIARVLESRHASPSNGPGRP